MFLLGGLNPSMLWVTIEYVEFCVLAIVVGRSILTWVFVVCGEEPIVGKCSTLLLWWWAIRTEAQGRSPM